MPSDLSFSDVMARLRSGDDEAGAEVFHRFAHRLVGLAHQRLDAHLHQKLDPEDIMQSVFRSLLNHMAAGELPDLKSWDGLWGLLVLMTLRKCRWKWKFYHAERRDVSREVRLMPFGNDEGAFWDICDREPTPDEVALLIETIEELLAQFSEESREILRLLLQGHPAHEISVIVGCTERMVYRVSERFKDLLQYEDPQ